MFIDGQNPPATPDRPRCACLIGGRTRVTVHILSHAGALGLRGTALIQPRCQHDVERHLEELALPILERGLSEMAGLYITNESDRGCGVLALLLVENPPPAQC